MEIPSVRAGGAIEFNSEEGDSISILECDFINNETNSSPGNGGALHVTGAGTSFINGGSVIGNTASLEGGGLWNGSGIMMVNGTMLTENIASGDGADEGGGALFNAGGILMVMNASFSNNTADGASGSGGGILSDLGDLYITNTIMSNNSAVRAGGAVEFKSEEGDSLAIINSNLDSNEVGSAPGNGGALHITGAGNSYIQGGQSIENSASLEGGAFWNGSGIMTVDGTVFTGNTASGDEANEGGGALFNAEGILMVMNATIHDNIADGSSGSGGGILSDLGDLYVMNSILYSNSAVRAGGAIEFNSVVGDTLSIVESELDSNEASSAPGNGGALHITGGGNSSIIGGSFSENIASLEGGALWNGNGFMEVNGTTIISNIASGNNANEGGGGIFNAGGTLTVTDAVLVRNIADGTSGSGGGILNDKGTLTVVSSDFTINEAVRAGGAIEDNADTNGILTLTDVLFENNIAESAPGNGGALHITGSGDALLSRIILDGNEAASEGGGLWNGTGTMTIIDLIAEDNLASGNAADNGGGALFNNGGDVNILGDVQFIGNDAEGTSGSGGAILSIAGSVNIDGSSFEDNAANRAGGAIEIIDGSLEINNTIMSENDVNGLVGIPNPGSGGAIHVTGKMTAVSIDSSEFYNNQAAFTGGALWNQDSSTMTISATTIDNNIAAAGGGVYNTGGMLEIETSTISGNEASGNVGGGAIYNKSGSLTLSRSTISGNTASNYGGGILNSGIATIDATTIANNNADSAGGIMGMTEVIITNTLIANNSATTVDNDVSGLITSDNFNFIEDNDGAIVVAMANDIVGVDPMLDTLKNNGGITMTHALLMGSAAINAGNPTSVFADQNGNDIIGTRDIGASEAGVTTGVNDELNAVKAVLYPNPAVGQFVIELDNSINESIEITLTNTSGQIVQSIKVPAGVSEVKINESTSGMYIVNILGSTTQETMLMQVAQ